MQRTKEMPKVANKFEAAQRAVDAFFEPSGRSDDQPESRLILKLAKRGMDAPEALSDKERQQVCNALIVHYAQMGIR